MPLYRRQKTVITVACQSAAVFAALQSLDTSQFQVREMISTGGLMQTLSQDRTALVIVRPEDLIETSQASLGVLRTALETTQSMGIPVVSPDEFAAQSRQWIGESLLKEGKRTGIRFMAPRTVLVTNYCGGVGKTTISIAMARRFREQTGLGAAVLEASVGDSSLNAYLGEHRSFYHIMTQSAAPDVWQEVDIYPLGEQEARLLGRDDRVRNALAAIQNAHTLTVLDVSPHNPLWPDLLSLASDIVMVTSSRKDGLAQTAAMTTAIQQSFQGAEISPRLHVVINRTRSAAERLSSRDIGDVYLPENARQARSFGNALADPLLGMLYPGWTKQKKKSQKNGRKTA